MSAEQLLVAILETCDIKFSSDDHAKIAAKIGGNVTGNAIRQRIQKIRKMGMAGTPKKTANAGGDDVGTPTPGKKQRGKANGKAGGKAKNGHDISAAADDNDDDDDDDDDDDEESPSKKRGGAGRKRGKVKAEVADESEPESPTKKVRREREVEELGDGLETSFFDQENGAYAI
ncbi:hypothetical protein GTA08_BOTSDO04731 [Neofusicoccum parvum]|nr:hypothetical protein GTA08_BOTSDO04731 [Neofusicoccum parvum]